MLQVSDRLLLSCYQSLNNYPYLNTFLSETKDSTFGRTNWNTTSYCLYTSWYKSRHSREIFFLIIRILNQVPSLNQVSYLKLLNNSLKVYNRYTERLWGKMYKQGYNYFCSCFRWSYLELCLQRKFTDLNNLRHNLFCRIFFS